MADTRIERRPIGVDLFAGAGGMTLGFEKAGYDVLSAVEVDPIHCATHDFNFPQWSVICRDISEVSGEDVRTHSTIDGQDIDVVFGGPPCQGFSLIGHRQLDDPRNHLVKHFVRLVLELRPKYVVMENVAGLTVGKHRAFLNEVIEDLRAGDYDVASPWQVLNAADYGVPQERRRLFLIGARRGLPLPQYPSPTTTRKGDLTLGGELSLPRTPTVWDAICDLPEAEEFPELTTRDWVHAEYGTPSSYGAILRGAVPENDDLSYVRLFDPTQLTSSMRTAHTSVSVRRFKETPHGETEPVSRFRRLDPQGFCNTLRAGTGSARGAFTSPRPIHPSTPRCITVREAARIHSYPDWFRFHATKWHGFRQIGNSVPPLLAQAVARQLVGVLGLDPGRPHDALALGSSQLLELTPTEAAKHYGVPSDVMGVRTRQNERRSLCG